MAEEKGDYNFAQMKGRAVQVSAGGKYFTAVNEDGNLYQLCVDGEEVGDCRWKKIAEEVSYAAVGEDGTIWYCGTDENIYRKGEFEDEEFDKMRGKCVQIDCSNKDEIVCVNNGGNIYKFMPDNNKWDKLPELPEGNPGAHVAVGADGTVCAIDEENFVFQYDAEDDSWERLKRGKGTKVWVADIGSIYIRGLNDLMYYRDAPKWSVDHGLKEAFDKEIVTMDLSSNGSAIVAREDQTLHCHVARQYLEIEEPERPLKTEEPERPLETEEPERPLETEEPERPLETEESERPPVATKEEGCCDSCCCIIS